MFSRGGGGGGGGSTAGSSSARNPGGLSVRVPVSGGADAPCDGCWRGEGGREGRRRGRGIERCRVAR